MSVTTIRVARFDPQRKNQFDLAGEIIFNFIEDTLFSQKLGSEQAAEGNLIVATGVTDLAGFSETLPQGPTLNNIQMYADAQSRALWDDLLYRFLKGKSIRVQGSAA